MSKYELAVVVNAQIDDEARTAVVDRCKNLITRFGGEIGEIEDWGKKKLAYEIQKMNEAYYYFIPFEGSRAVCALWTMSSDICVLRRTKLNRKQRSE